MADAVHLEIPGKPVPLSRTGHGQFGGRWLATSSSRQLGLLVDAWQRAGEPRLSDDAPVMATLTFTFQRPASHFRTGRNAHLLRGSAPSAPISRPDLDNLVKLALEAMQGNAIADDSRVVGVAAAKAFGERAGTTIDLAELPS